MGGLQLIVTGDFFQLPPVTKTKNINDTFTNSNQNSNQNFNQNFSQNFNFNSGLGSSSTSSSSNYFTSKAHPYGRVCDANPPLSLPLSQFISLPLSQSTSISLSQCSLLQSNIVPIYSQSASQIYSQSSQSTSQLAPNIQNNISNIQFKLSQPTNITALSVQNDTSHPSSIFTFQDDKIEKKNEKKKNLFCFQSHVWKEIIARTFVLTDVFRQSDIGFSSLLNSIRRGDLNGKEAKTYVAVSIIPVFFSLSFSIMCHHYYHTYTIMIIDVTIIYFQNQFKNLYKNVWAVRSIVRTGFYLLEYSLTGRMWID